ncbi:hypothetical protein AB5L52_12840 [Streptomyces sp. CG4]|uniref:hypothetical protein n=1 Tax=Streptomyces sp. CG4 TaxID=408783 RepID=UPI0034E1F396
MYRGAGSGQNYRTLYNDIHAAFARYNLGKDVPFTPYGRRSGTGHGRWREQSVLSATARGEIRPVSEILHNHYARRRRLSPPVCHGHGREGARGRRGRRLRAPQRRLRPTGLRHAALQQVTYT